MRKTALKSRNFFYILHFNLYFPHQIGFFHNFVGSVHPRGGSASAGRSVHPRGGSASAGRSEHPPSSKYILQSVNMCHYAAHSGFDGQLGAVVEACFDQHTVDVCLYRSLGYVKLVGNFGVGHSGGHEAKYIQLPL